MHTVARLLAGLGRFLIPLVLMASVSIPFCMQSGYSEVSSQLATQTNLKGGQVSVAGTIPWQLTQQSASLVPSAVANATDTNVGSFIFAGDTIFPRWLHTATLLNDGRVLIAGGFVANGGGVPSSATAELYEPGQGFLAVQNMNQGRAQAAAALLSSGNVLIVGGASTNGVESALATAEVFNVDKETFSRTGSMSFDRINPAAVRLRDGRVLVIGGADHNPVTLASAELYDAATGTFTPTGAMHDSRLGFTATLLQNGGVLVTGGISYYPLSYLSSAELYDPPSGTFIPTGSLNIGRNNHAATLLDDGDVLITGGVNGNPLLHPEQTAEVYNPSTGKFTLLAASMNTSHISHTATTLNDGRALIVGAFLNAIPNVAELYDPTSEVFVSGPNMIEPREYHTATKFANGTILIVGGIGFLPRNTAELYVPAGPTFAGQPGKANCHGKSVSALGQKYGGMASAASALGFASVKALQDAIKAFCGA